MRALLVVAHGSRRPASNDEVAGLTERVRKLLAQSDRVQNGSEFAHVSCAFLELAEPSIPEGIEQCIGAGANEVVVLPYFLSAGRHVSEDIPGIVQQAQQRWPQTKIHIAPYLGTAASLPDVMLGLAK